MPPAVVTAHTGTYIWAARLYVARLAVSDTWLSTRRSDWFTIGRTVMRISIGQATSSTLAPGTVRIFGTARTAAPIAGRINRAATSVAASDRAIVARYATTATYEPSPTTSRTIGVCSPFSRTVTWFLPRPVSTRWPNAIGSVSAITARHEAAARGPDPGSRPSPMNMGHRPRPLTRNTATSRTAPDPTSTRMLVISTRH